MSEIHKKAWSSSFQKILSGEKTYELRLADWKCEPGDILILDEVDDVTKEPTGRSVRRKVGHIGAVDGNKYWPVEDIENYGLRIISLLEEES